MSPELPPAPAETTVAAPDGARSPGIYAPTVDILMYHSVAEASGPTSIAPHVFERQISQLAQSGLKILRMGEIIRHLTAGSGRAAAVTFDDGFDDFRQTAWPVLTKYGIPAMVYIPVARMGGVENWTGAHIPPRPLMSWADIRALRADGVDFGNHTLNHADLSQLDEATLVSEIEVARDRLSDELGEAPTHFAPPYGRSTARARHTISQRHATSVGTVLATANSNSDRFDLPRIEMYYFQKAGRWNAHLAGRGGGYIRVRKTLRTVRGTLNAILRS